MELLTLTVVLVIALALFFDFTNGFHDTANAMATPIATGALKPKTAVALAAILNLIGALLSTEVAKTVSGGILHEDRISGDIFPFVIFAGLIGAIFWNMLTWLLGLPFQLVPRPLRRAAGRRDRGHRVLRRQRGRRPVEDHLAGPAVTADRGDSSRSSAPRSPTA